MRNQLPLEYAIWSTMETAPVTPKPDDIIEAVVSGGMLWGNDTHFKVQEYNLKAPAKKNVKLSFANHYFSNWYFLEGGRVSYLKAVDTIGNYSK